MKTLTMKKTVAAIWLAFALTFGSGLVTTQLDIDIIPTTHACELGAGSGGGC